MLICISLSHTLHDYMHLVNALRTECLWAKKWVRKSCTFSPKSLVNSMQINYMLDLRNHTIFCRCDSRILTHTLTPYTMKYAKLKKDHKSSCILMDFFVGREHYKDDFKFIGISSSLSLQLLRIFFSLSLIIMYL